MFLNAEEFVGEMPKEYKETIKMLNTLIEVWQGKLISDDIDEVKFAEVEISKLREIASDMCRAKKTVEHYYKGDRDLAYSVVGRINGKCYIGHGESVVERLVFNGEDLD